MWIGSMFLGKTFAWSAFFTLVHHFQSSRGLPSGAPSIACSSMTPVHFAFQPQPLDHCNFTVRQSKLRYRSGNDTVTVTLTVQNETTREYFRGYLVKALNPLTNHAIGQFREQFDVRPRPICHAATHTNSNSKNEVVLSWIPDDADEQANWVVFEATFVETFRKFFVGVESTFRGKPARDVIQKEIGRKSHRSETESELSTKSSDSEGKKHSEPNASEPRVIDQSDTGKEKLQEDRTFWF
ncbi:putative ferric-chelate reductase 1 homolog [Varroa jacobsoni]|uniref:putative ferric-chelate reductase 1 homolog n=1 Tax=Varroa jacobsoni TaxID=62625 RepID=UPI000BF2D371|nr:putative ferric-chelate reductase 1 homolog [Varroa jacobsoni]